jgi:hypothetical protein
VPLLDDEERRHELDPESVEQVGALVLVDAVDPEGPVVAAALEHLREEALDAPAVAGLR